VLRNFFKFFFIDAYGWYCEGAFSSPVASPGSALGCISRLSKGWKLRLLQGKTLQPGKELSYAFSGPVNLTVKVSSNVPVEVKIVGENTVLKDFGETTKVNAVVHLPEGKWKVVIKNTGKDMAKLDIELKGS